MTDLHLISIDSDGSEPESDGILKRAAVEAAQNRSRCVTMLKCHFSHSSAHCGSKASAHFGTWTSCASPDWRGHLFRRDLFPSAGLNLSRSRCHSSVSDPGHLWTSQTRPQSEHDGPSSKFCQLFSCTPVVCSGAALLPSCHNMPWMQNKPWLCTELNGVPVLLPLLYCFRTKLSFLIYKTMHFLMIHKWGFKLLFFHSVDTLTVSINIVK